MNGFINNDFNADGSITAGTSLSATTSVSAATGAITNQLTANAFDGANSVSVPGGWVSNLGLTYASSTLSITSADGSALSASNPGYVIMQDISSTGLLKKYTITANQGFIDATGASEIAGNLFSLLPGIAYTNTIPFYIYAVPDDSQANIAFMISRVPHRTQSCPAANMGDPSSAVADVQAAMFSFEDITQTSYDNNPCICIGSFRMTMDASDDWTVQSLLPEDGIGRFNDSTNFTLPGGVFGAAANSVILPNGGTAPTFNTLACYYCVSKDGICSYYFNANTDAGTDGAGAVISFLVCPYLSESYLAASYIGSGVVTLPSSTVLPNFQLQTNQTIALYYPTSATAATFILNSDFTNGTRVVQGSVRFPIKRSI